MGIGESIVYTGLGRPVSCRSTMQSAYLIFDLAKVLSIVSAYPTSRGVRRQVKKRPVSKVLSLGSDGRAMDHCGTVAPACQAAPARRAPARRRYAGSPQYAVLPEPQRLPMG